MLFDTVVYYETLKEPQMLLIGGLKVNKEVKEVNSTNSTNIESSSPQKNKQAAQQIYAKQI